MSEGALDSAALARMTSTLRPAAEPWTGVVAITDTNALLRRACHEVRYGLQDNIFRGLSRTGRSNTFVAAHVPMELVKYLPTVADKNGVDHNVVEATLRDTVMTGIPVVDLPIREFLHPRVRTILSADPSMPKRLRGDPDDAGTAALAEFLAPAIILSADNVFERLGISSTAAVAYVETARTLIRMTGFEATITETVQLVNIAIRATGFLGAHVVRGIRENPLVSAAIFGAIWWLAHRFGYLKRDRVQEGLRSLGRMAGPILEATNAAIDGAQGAREALRAVEPYGAATVEQTTARHLARRGLLTPGELRDELRGRGMVVPATTLKRAMASHPAFVRIPGDRYRVGALMTWRPAETCLDSATTPQTSIQHH